MRFINLHTHQKQNPDGTVAVVNQYPSQIDDSLEFYSTGIHPWYIDINTIETELAAISLHIDNQNCIAVGECGLDKRIEVAFDIQIDVFKKQLALAQMHSKPVIIHCVAAFQELIAIKNSMQLSVPMIIHGFSKSVELAQQLIENGFYLSFGKYLVQNPNVESVFTHVARERIFLETDDESIDIEQVYTIAAACRQITVEAMVKQIQINYNSVFNSGSNNKSKI